MTTEQTPAEGNVSAKPLDESALHDAACSAKGNAFLGLRKLPLDPCVNPDGWMWEDAEGNVICRHPDCVRDNESITPAEGNVSAKPLDESALHDASCSACRESSRGWLVFSSEDAREIALNDARLRGDREMEERILSKSSLDLPAFRKQLELRVSGAKFLENPPTDDVQDSFQLHLIAEDFGNVFSKIRELFLSGVITHCSLDLALPSVCFGYLQNVKVEARGS